jgi:HAE1 family hydrophobic/amphiphilic exporter-1
MNLVDFCLKRPVTTVMFFTALVILGVVSYSKMRVDLFPEITYPTLNVSVSYSGAGPEEIEQMITIPIEQAVATVNGVKNITSVSQEGSSRVTAEFDWGRDLGDATDDLRTSLDRVVRRLPEDAGTPTVSKWNPSSRPILSLGVSGQMNEYDLRRFAEEDLTNMIQRVDGVASVDVMGGKKREINVRLYNDRLQAFGITADQVVNALKSENAMLPAGHLTTHTGDFFLRTQGQFEALDEMQNLVVATRNNAPIYLNTLAEVEEGFEDEQSVVRIDGKPGIVVSVRKRSDANTVATADQIYKALKEVEERYPDVKIRILNDNSTYIRNAVRSVTDSAWQGAILAALVLLFFLANIRMTAFAAIVMPISILTTLILAYFSKMTLNTISLGGLALGVGMLVDNTVVVLDNIFRHHQRGSGDLVKAAREGTAEMGPALMASTITTICVFFPMVFLTGRNGIIYKELSYMVIYSIMCSMFVSLTLIPMLCAKALKPKDLDEDIQSAHGGIKGILFGIQLRWETAYEKVLRWALARKVKVVVGCALVFLLSMTLYPLIGEELVQTTDEGIISLNLQLPSGTQLDATTAHAERIERQIRQLVPELKNLEMTVGGRWGQGGQTHRAYFTIRLSKKEERRRSTQQIVELLQQKIQVPGARIRVSAENSMRMFYGGSDSPVVIDIRGYDQNLAKQVSDLVIDKISQVPGIVNISGSRDEERPELLIRIDRKRAADLGVSADQIASALQMHVEGKIATIYRKDGHEYQVRVNLREADRTSWKDLERIMVSGRNGANIPLAGLVKFVQSDGKVNIERKDQERNVSVEAGIAGRDLGSVIRDVQKELRKIELPQGFTLHIAGDYEEQQNSNKEMLLVLILSLILVYMVMAAQFESFLDPFLIMFTVPFGLSGVILTLFLTDTAFNSQVYLGLIMLGGIVVDNAIVIVSYFRILMEKGLSVTEAVIQGGKSRLRPVFMTTATTILGLVPLALGLGEGGETQAPMARTVIGGLTFSTVLTLVIIPVIFAGVESMINRLKERRIRLGKAATTIVMLMLTLVVFHAPALHAAPPETDGPLELTIDQAIALALKNNPASKIMDYRREEAESIYRENLAGKKAKVFAELEAESPESNQHGGNRLAVTAEQKTYLKNLFGAKSLNDQIAEYNRSITLIGIAGLEQDLIYQTVELYQKAIRAQNNLKLARDSYDRAKAFQEEVMARSQVGKTDITEELGAEAKVSEALTQVKRDEKAERVAFSRLKRMVGLGERTELRLVQPSADWHEPVFQELIDAALQNRSDIKLANESLKRAQTLLKLVKLSKNIGMNLEWVLEKEHFEGGLGLTNQDKDGTAGEWQTSWNAAAVTNEPYLSDPEWGILRLTFRYNIFDGGRTKERIKQAELSVNQLVEDEKRIREDVLLEIEAAYYDYLDQRDLLNNAEIQCKYHQVYLDATLARMRTGLASVKDVLDAQTLLTQSEIARERIKGDLYLAGIKLMQVTGRLKRDLK